MPRVRRINCPESSRWCGFKYGCGSTLSAFTALIAVIRKEATSIILIGHYIGQAAYGNVQLNIVDKRDERKDRDLDKPIARVRDIGILVEPPPEKMVSE